MEARLYSFKPANSIPSFLNVVSEDNFINFSNFLHLINTIKAQDHVLLTRVVYTEQVKPRKRNES